MRSILFLLLLFVLGACTSSSDQISNVHKSNAKDLVLDKSRSLSKEQEEAFDALNLIQVSTDEKSQFYSTFGGIDQPFYPPDSSFQVSQEELHKFFTEFLYRHCSNLPKEQQEELAKKAVLAQEMYTVLHCSNARQNVSYEFGIPMSDKWLIQNVLGRRDIVIQW